MSYEETSFTEERCEHCEHYHDWPMAADQEEPYGDPGDGLGVQGFCCRCPAARSGLLDETVSQTEVG